jgi:uncharacterized membrane protein YgaE (UPF0421/DUF939 family)
MNRSAAWSDRTVTYAGERARVAMMVVIAAAVITAFAVINSPVITGIAVVIIAVVTAAAHVEARPGTTRQ